MWQEHTVSKPFGEHLIAIWTSEIGLKRQQICKAVFESPTAYRLIAPDLKLDVLKGNCTDFEVKKVPDAICP